MHRLGCFLFLPISQLIFVDCILIQSFGGKMTPSPEISGTVGHQGWFPLLDCNPLTPDQATIMYRVGEEGDTGDEKHGDTGDEKHGDTGDEKHGDTGDEKHGDT